MVPAERARPGAPSSSSVVFNVPNQELVLDVDVLVVASTTDLSHATLTLTSPALTTVTLMSPAAGVPGRDLHTIFDDSAPVTLASGVAPYVDGVAPQNPLSAFGGEATGGQWTLELQMDSGHTEALWTAALLMHGIPVSVENSTTPPRVALRNIGPNPVQGQGSLAFTLPHEAHVDLALYDLTGRRVRTLVYGVRPSGSCSVSWNSGGLAPGVYRAALRVEGDETRSLSLAVVR